jgi:hypothetical protein
MAPKQSGLTRSPVRPSVTYSFNRMSFLLMRLSMWPLS